jgi:putative ATPase
MQNQQPAIGLYSLKKAENITGIGRANRGDAAGARNPHADSIECPTPSDLWLKQSQWLYYVRRQPVDLFTNQRQSNREKVKPLSVRMRPKTIDDFVGQGSFLGDGKLLRRMVAADRLTSVLFYGPPGTGKTSLAEVIASVTSAHFSHVNAAAVGVKELRQILDAARERLESAGGRSILFVDELHRFNKAQQDILLSDVEDGIVTFIGATTENPFFAVNAALTSRSQIFQFEALDVAEIKTLMKRALDDSENGLGAYQVKLDDEAAEHLAIVAEGDARRALNALEIAVLSLAGEQNGAVRVDLKTAEESIQRKAIKYDKSGDSHYDTISAMIKSIRGSDPDAAVYWLARMLEAGEDPRYIARRIVIAAAEDVGNADPKGLILAQAAADATAMIGMPECELPLAQAVIFLAGTPKSNACARAIWSARADVREGRAIPVPRSLKSSGYVGAKRLGSGDGYRYPHDESDGIVTQDYLGVEKVYYTPTGRGAESIIQKYLAAVRAKRESDRETGQEAGDKRP